MRNRSELAMRSAALLLALLAMGSQALSAAHFALVRHVRCAEHGELVHVARGEHRPAHKGPGVSQRAAVAHAHDHCLVALHQRERQDAPVRVAALVTPSALRPLVVRPLAGARHHIALLHLAPKSSPPAIG